MNRLPTHLRASALDMLVEGSSLRSASRHLGVSINTVTRLLVAAGEAASATHDGSVRGVRAGRVQCDEVWTFCYAKDRRGATGIDRAGSVWAWTGVDVDTRLLVSWMCGGRDADYANEFMLDLASRVEGRLHLTTDGHAPYAEAVAGAFGRRGVDYAQLIKRYDSRGEYAGSRKEAVYGDPDLRLAGTSHVERLNLTLRMAVRRYTREVNAFSKKFANHVHHVALWAVWYNFMRPHRSLGGATPAMAAGLAERPLGWRWLLDEVDRRAPEPAPRLLGVRRWLDARPRPRQGMLSLG